ncbi:uncharacterized protein LOC143029955 [Oratosquilla oratoria]|uniref:uncharacterized protein LOC143029955 n=1 Tax=Oratosquilla oratoria TaxID=337810 RepID=UPI003F767BFB
MSENVNNTTDVISYPSGGKYLIASVIVLYIYHEKAKQGKIYERIPEKKLRCIVEDVLHEAQQGFGPGRGTTDLVFALKIIIEKSWEWDIKKYVALLDLEKAFDRVPRQMLRRAMRKAEYQIPPKLERAIKGFYVSNETLVRPVAKEEKWFYVTSGVR